MVKIRDKNVVAYRTLYTEQGAKVVQECENVAKYKVCVLLKTGLVECTCRHFLRYESVISEKCTRLNIECLIKGGDVVWYLGYRLKPEGCEMVKIRDKNAVAYRTLYTEQGAEVVQECDNVAEYKREVEVQVSKPPSWTSENVIEDIDVVKQVTNAS
nr:hypothetical protein [Tanacetum cinerariifolium]